MVKQTRPFRILSQQFEHQCSDATFPCEYFEALTLLPCPRTLTTFLVMSRFEIHRLASVFATRWCYADAANLILKTEMRRGPPFQL